MGLLYLVGLVFVCLFILSDGSGLGAHSDVEPVPAEKRRIFQFFSIEVSIEFNTGNIAQPFWVLGFQYSLFFVLGDGSGLGG